MEGPSEVSTKSESTDDRWHWKFKSTRDYIGFLFNNEIFSDIIFIVDKDKEEQQKIFAHKFIVCGRSSAFDDMFNGPNATSSKEVELPADVSLTGFLVFLKFIYCDKNTIDTGNVLSALAVAKKYEVRPLEAFCQKFLIANLQKDNVFTRLIEAQHFNQPLLVTKCLELIDVNAKEMLFTESFLDIDIDGLCLILERDTLAIGESELFRAIEQWLHTKCEKKKLDMTAENKRYVLGRALKQIRFPLMTVTEFANGPIKSNLLTPEEALELYRHLTVFPKPSTTFISRPRMRPIPSIFNMSGQENSSFTLPDPNSKTLAFNFKPSLGQPSAAVPKPLHGKNNTTSVDESVQVVTKTSAFKFGT